MDAIRGGAERTQSSPRAATYAGSFDNTTTTLNDRVSIVWLAAEHWNMTQAKTWACGFARLARLCLSCMNHGLSLIILRLHHCNVGSARRARAGA
jgi:hypothetical protein